ncbi:unnamed protein product [Effrenium voratum]|nr:unnamed protein product [Effrenium voratum]
MQPLATQLVKTAAATVGRQDATSCQELQDMCHRLDARLLRLVCGQTCECTDPFSSPWYKTEAQGCSSTCLRLARRNKPNNHCEDVRAEVGLPRGLAELLGPVPGRGGGLLRGRPVQPARAHREPDDVQDALGRVRGPEAVPDRRLDGHGVVRRHARPVPAFGAFVPPELWLQHLGGSCSAELLPHQLQFLPVDGSRVRSMGFLDHE